MVLESSHRSDNGHCRMSWKPNSRSSDRTGVYRKETRANVQNGRTAHFILSDRSRPMKKAISPCSSQGRSSSISRSAMRTCCRTMRTVEYARSRGCSPRSRSSAETATEIVPSSSRSSLRMFRIRCQRSARSFTGGAAQRQRHAASRVHTNLPALDREAKISL